jgi:hypothetical protein
VIAPEQYDYKDLVAPSLDEQSSLMLKLNSHKMLLLMSMPTRQNAKCLMVVVMVLELWRSQSCTWQVVNSSGVAEQKKQRGKEGGKRERERETWQNALTELQARLGKPGRMLPPQC